MRIVLTGIVLAIVVLGFALIRFVLYVVRVRRGQRGKPGPGDALLFIVALIGLLILAYGLWIEPRRVEVTTVSIASHKVRGTPIRIVHLSDIHSPTNMSVQRRLPGIVRALRPDLIVFSGDALGTHDGIEPLRETFHALAEIAPVAAIYGNRDIALRVPNIFDGTGAHTLRGEAVVRRVGETEVALVGASSSSERLRVRRALRAQDSSTYVIYVGHSPDEIEDVGDWGADLLLAGHTHGGQVALPFYGALWTASRTGKQFEAGLYRVGRTDLYVNRGIGMEAHLPRLRILARPEVTLLLIGPAVK